MKGPGAKRSNYQNQVNKKIKKHSLEPHYPNFRAIIVAKSLFSSARIIRECKFAISIKYKNSIFIEIRKNKHKLGFDRFIEQSGVWSLLFVSYYVTEAYARSQKRLDL